MTAKHVLFRSTAPDKVLRGAAQLADAVLTEATMTEVPESEKEHAPAGVDV
jgi:hypothetical protein